MFAHFKRLANQIIFYGLGDAISRLVAVLILPIFTRYLTPADYGVASLLTVTNSLIVSLSDFGLVSSIIRLYRHETPAKQREMIATAQLTMVASTLLIAILAIPFAGAISQFFFKTDAYRYIVMLNFFTIPLTKVLTAPLVRFRIEEKAKLFAGINALQTILMIGLNFFLVVSLHRGVNGLFEGPFLSALFFAIFIGGYSLKTNGWHYSWPLFKKMAVFGAPLILNSVSMWIINWADRFLLSRFVSLSEVGLYTLGYSIGMAISLPVSAFIAAWPPFYMAVSEDNQAKKIYSSIFTYYSLIIGFCVLIVAVFGRDYFYFFTANNFHAAAAIVPLIALAYGLRGHFSITAAAAYLTKKTYLVTLTELIAMAINIGLILALVPFYGRLGAAWATLISFLVLPVSMWLLTKRDYPISYEWKRLFQIVFIGIIIFSVTQFLYQPSLFNTALRAGIILLYPLAFFLINFFDQAEVSRLKNIKQRFFQIKS